MKNASASVGEGRMAVTVDLAVTGEGAVAFAYGGDLPHVGGVVLAAPGPELHGRQLSRCDLWQVTVPGHKDAEAAAALARRLCLALGQPVSVTCGIHVDDATGEEIRQLGENCLAAADAALAQLES